ncbi:hypothetical protein F3Y22_tig00002237pilonHSYRG02010 [Hibiscus syriacus]|uniref:Protein kinase domain-containing protein n=1 Tax=Hibiscus syriacus TaxID=106335 RepID=A0A6A3CV30_HIBSY|nr:hypothetical protein F3Y22_tig00002237pilonHSYRG02010 [Hibiscus syriacus]
MLGTRTAYVSERFSLALNLKYGYCMLFLQIGDFRLSRIKRNTLVYGGVQGTLPWMAPELLNGSGTKVDVFSYGISMWEILIGEEPYANMHSDAIISKILIYQYAHSPD